MVCPRVIRFGPIIAAAIFCTKFACAASYSEFVDGELSGNGAAPTAWALGAGANVLVAESSSTDFDILRISVPSNHTLNSLIVEFHEDVNRVFTGVQAGAVWTAGTGFEIDPTFMLGWTDFPTNPNHTHTGEDILDDMGLGAGASGFLPPLPSGDYTFLFQTPSNAIRFALSYNVSLVGAGLPGDFNGDQTVNGADLQRWEQAYGTSAGADADVDGDSDGTDYLVWQQNLTSAVTVAANAVPEPGASALAVAAMGGLAMCRRKAWLTACVRTAVEGRRPL